MVFHFNSSSSESLKGYQIVLSDDSEALSHKRFLSLLEAGADGARKNCCDFTFVFPVNESYRQILSDHGYVDAFFKVPDHYVPGHDFNPDPAFEVRCLMQNDVQLVLDFLSCNPMELQARTGLYKAEFDRDYWANILSEYTVGDRNVVIVKGSQGIVAVAFITMENSEVIVKTYVGECWVENTLLAGISSLFPDKKMTVINNLEDVLNDARPRLWSPFYAQNNAPSAEYEEIAEMEIPFDVSKAAFPAGMVRILDIDSVMTKTGLSLCESFKGLSREELIHLILRRPVGHQADALEKILDLPEISFIFPSPNY